MRDERMGETRDIVLHADGSTHSVMRECLRLQEEAPLLGRIGRLFGRSPLGSEARGWYRGVIGELRVTSILEALPTPWQVLHTHPIGETGTGIDHVIVGPAGVYAVTTTIQSGHHVTFGGDGFRIDGFQTPQVRLARQEAYRASRLLTALAGQSIDVTPLLVVVDAVSVRYDAGLVGSSGTRRAVEVVAAGRLARWLRKRPAVLSPELVGLSGRVVHERGLWVSDVSDGSPGEPGPAQVKASVEPDPGGVLRGFRRLQADVEAARRRARGWLVAATSAFAGVVTFETAYLVSIAIKPFG